MFMLLNTSHILNKVKLGSGKGMEHNQENKIPNMSVNVIAAKDRGEQEWKWGGKAINPMSPFCHLIFQP
jgi:hypothetical protein